MVIRTGGTRVQGLGEPPGDVGGTAGPIYLKAFLIRESKNPFRQAWLGNDKIHTRSERNLRWSSGWVLGEVR